MITLLIWTPMITQTSLMSRTMLMHGRLTYRLLPSGHQLRRRTTTRCYIRMCGLCTQMACITFLSSIVCAGVSSPTILAFDLVASRLIPASFDRIRTLFTAQMLDYFRLCNLELKASAYQFNQLLRRITLPMAPSQVLNLYNELRRMSRLWRWMKRLKWNGFGHNGKDPMLVEPGELAIYCPTCPQPGINIPDNWKDDSNRFVFRRLFVADGNFKADHVRQPKSKGDHWLSEGGGIGSKT